MGYLTTGRMTLTNQKVTDLKAAIESIPPLNKAPKALFALAKNLNRLNSLDRDRSDARQKLFHSVFGADVVKVANDDVRIPEFEKQYAAVLAVEVDFVPHQITTADLNVEVNVLSPKQIADLGPILSDL